MGCTNVMEPEIVWETVKEKMAGKAELLPLNRKAFEMGLERGVQQR